MWSLKIPLSIVVLYGWLAIVIDSAISHPDELSFYSNEKGFVCIADGKIFDSAVDFIYPIGNDLTNSPRIESHLEPDILNGSKSSIECDITKGKPCNERWSMENWKIETHSSLSFVPVLDSRWEKFGTIFTKNNVTSDKVMLPLSPMNIGLSIRATNDAEILLCNGWDQNKYSCIGLEINEKNQTINLKKYEKGLANGTKLIKAANISDNFLISPNEWRTYTLTITGDNKTLTLTDRINQKLVFNHSQETNLDAVYLFVRSNEPTLWKIHKNDFLYTDRIGTTKFGSKPIALSRSKFCVSFRTAMCTNCRLTLISNNNATGKEEILANMSSTNAEEWQFQKIYIPSKNMSELPLYVKTEVNDKNVPHPFWAIDDIRECARREVKVYRMNRTKTADDSNVWCQCLKHPQMKPEMQVLPKFKDLPKLKYQSTPTSLEISWKDNADIGKIHPHYYVLAYKGQPLCKNETEKDIWRVQSVDYEIVMHKNNVTFTDLVPFTHYAVTFKDILYDQLITGTNNTVAFDKPTSADLPQNMRYNVTNTTATLEWDERKCYETFAPILYTVKWLNFNKTVFETKFRAEKLDPFTNYTVIIGTKVHMTLKETESIERRFNFTTSSGISGPLENVEVYATDVNLAKLRYDLPKKRTGPPESVSLRYCRSSAPDKCETLTVPLKRCQLWTNKYCSRVDRLAKHENYTFELALKNVNASSYGSSVRVAALTTQSVPNKPLNVSAAILNCPKTVYDCHVKINWTYPYNPHAAIDTFEIEINAEQVVGNNVNRTENIISSVTVKDHASSTFSSTVQHIPYGKTYNVSVKSCNVKYCSAAETTKVAPTNLPNATDQSPKLIEIHERTLTFRLVKLDGVAWASSKLYVIVQDYDGSVKKRTLPRPLNMTDGVDYRLCNSYGNAWMSAYVQLNESVTNLTIGDNRTYGKYVNKELSENTDYCITFLFVNEYNKNKYLTVYHEKLRTKEKVVEEGSSKGYVVVLVMLLILIPVAWMIYKYYWKRGKLRSCMRRGDGEPAYEYIRTELISNGVYQTS